MNFSEVISFLIPVTILGHLYVAYIQVKGKKINLAGDYTVFQRTRFRLMIWIHLIFNFFSIAAIITLFSIEESTLVNCAKISLFLCTACASFVFSSAFRVTAIFLLQGLPASISCILLIIQLKAL